MAEKMQPERSRKWNITINNPQDSGFTHQQIKEVIEALPSIIYWCMADEIGNKEHTYHTHLYICLKNPIRFNTLKKKFPQAHLETAIRSSAENRDYVFKKGKWANTDKSETQVPNTQEQGGTLPNDTLKPLQDNEKFYGRLYRLIEGGYTDGEIIRENPNYLPLISKFGEIRNAIRTTECAYTKRNVEVYFVWGKYRFDKIREIKDTYGDANVHCVIDYKQPFEDYDCQDILILEEFNGNMPLHQLLHYLEEYPIKLPARYTNKVSCYTKVFIVSDVPFMELYTNYQLTDKALYNNFYNKITKVYQCTEANHFIELEANEIWLPESELPFGKDTTDP